MEPTAFFCPWLYTSPSTDLAICLCLGCILAKSDSANRKKVYKVNVGVGVQSLASESRLQTVKTIEHQNEYAFMNRRNLINLGFGLVSLLSGSTFAEAAGLPPEEKPKLCDDACEKELENVWWDYIAP